MSIQRQTRRDTFRRLAIVVALLALLGSAAWGVDRLTAPPESRSGAEAQLDRSLLVYERWGDTPVVIFQLEDRLYLDRLRLDLISIEWPPTPRWQWTGNWSYMEVTTDPASVGFVREPYGTALFGQVNDPAIVSLEVSIDGIRTIYPAAQPAFLIRLPDDSRKPDGYRWLDADGNNVWSTADEDVEP